MITKINSKLNFLLKREIIISLIIFFIGLYFLFQFETMLMAKYVLSLLLISLLVIFFFKQQLEFIIYPILYLLFFICYNLYYLMGISPIIIFLVLIIGLTNLTHLFINNINSRNTLIEIDKITKYFYLTLFNLIIIEFFISLLAWPTDPRGKSVILLIIFYILQTMVLAWLTRSFVLKKILPSVIIGIIIIFGIIMTTAWYII